MNKLRILKSSLFSTALLSIVILIATSFIMVVFPLAYYQSFARISDDDIAGYSEDIADYSAVSFASLENHQYYNLCKTFDMENFAGTASYGYVEYKSPDELDSPQVYELLFVSEKAANELPALHGYNFSKTKPKNYREAYAPTNLKNVYKVGEIYTISCYEGVYYKEWTIKILGYCENPYYDFYPAYYTESFLKDMWSNFLIFDDIPTYAKIESGLMMSDKSSEYYSNLGAYARVVREMNIDRKTSEVNDFFLYWCISAIILIVIVVMANYYFASDKLIKRSGVMYIYGGKRSTIICTEIVKMLLLFFIAMLIATMIIGIVIAETSYPSLSGETLASDYVDWKTHFTCVGIMFAAYLASISLGLIKLLRFKPLKALSNNNIE